MTSLVKNNKELQSLSIFTVSSYKEYLHIKIEIEEGVNFPKRNDL